MSANNSSVNKKRGASAMLSSDDVSVYAVVNTVPAVKVDEDMEDHDNVVKGKMLATLYSPAVDRAVRGAEEKKFPSVVMPETQDMDDHDNVVKGKMLATLYSPAVDKAVRGADEKKFKSVVMA